MKSIVYYFIVVHNVALDIFYVYEDTVQYLCEFKFVEGCTSWIDSMERAGHVLCNRVEVPLSERVIRVPFESIEVNVPENYHEWPSTRYGLVYFLHHRCKIKEMDVLFQGQKIRMYWLNRLRMFYRHAFLAPFSHYEPIWLDRSFIRGLNRDGIDLDFDTIIP